MIDKNVFPLQNEKYQKLSIFGKEVIDSEEMILKEIILLEYIYKKN